MSVRLPLIFIFPVFLLSACTQASALPDIDSSETYRGYPCFDQCEAFSQGYNQAETKQFSSSAQCDTLPEPERNGCRSFVTDFKVDSQQNGGLHLQSSP